MATTWKNVGHFYNTELWLTCTKSILTASAVTRIHIKISTFPL